MFVDLATLLDCEHYMFRIPPTRNNNATVILRHLHLLLTRLSVIDRRAKP
jgi:hypothetical protein